MNEPIQEILELSGTLLDFNTFEFYGLPGFEISALYKGEQSLYEIRQQHFTFHVATEDLAINPVTVGQKFFIPDSAYIYTFSVQRPPEPDLTGMSVLFADYIGKVHV